MSATLIDGKLIAAKINEETARRAAELGKRGFAVKLAVILVGDDKPSHKYVKNKQIAAEKAGIEFVLAKMPDDSTTEAVLKKINELQADKNLSGLIVQLPLPRQIDTDSVINAINPKIDVDCLTDINLGKIVMTTNYMVPPTPGAVVRILKRIGVKLIGKIITIVGTGKLVGKPLAIMMMNEQATVLTANHKTKDLKALCRQADIIVSGVGKKNLIKKDMVKKGAIVIDTGVSFDNGEMHGDVDVNGVVKRASQVTPTPGGVGPVTVAGLLRNTIICAEKNNNIKENYPRSFLKHEPNTV